MINQLPKSLIESVQNIVEKETEYQKFFRSALKKFGVTSPKELTGDKEKEFYNYIDKNWKGKTETDEAMCSSERKKKMSEESVDLDEAKTFKSLEDWVMAVVDAGGTISKRGNTLAASGLKRTQSATWEINKGRGSMLESVDLDEMRGATSGRRQSRTFPLSKQREADAFAKKHGGEVEKKGMTLYVTYDLPESVEEVDEAVSPKTIIKDFEELKKSGKKISAAIDILASKYGDGGGKYKGMSKDAIAKIVGDHLRKSR